MDNQTLHQNEEKGNRAVLALDLGSATGWAISRHEFPVISGTESFKPGRYEGGGMRFLRFGNWLDEVAKLSGGLKVVHFEEVRRHMGVDASHVYGGFLATLTAWCESHQIPYQGVPVGTIKKHITGKGNASKAKVIHAVKRLGHHPADDNEADALALLHFVKSREVA